MFIDVVWQTPNGFVTDFDIEYIVEVLFKEVSINKHFDEGNLLFVKENALIVYSANSRKISLSFEAYLKVMKDFSLFHLSNESLNHKTTYYKLAQVVLRSYFDPLKAYKNVFFLPIGFKSGFHNKNNEINTLDQRSINWAFIGQIKNHRKEMITELENINSNYRYITEAWNDSKQMHVDEIIEIYKKTIYVPCPFGSVNPDSFRIMESLEWGCIPVVVKYHGIDYYKYIFGDHPFIIADTWTAAAIQMKRLLLNPDALNEKFQQTVNWYKKYKKDLAADIKSILINRAKPEMIQFKSPQFSYQRYKSSKKTYFIFWKNFYFKKSWAYSFFKKVRHRIKLLFKISIRETQ